MLGRGLLLVSTVIVVIGGVSSSSFAAPMVCAKSAKDFFAAGHQTDGWVIKV